MIEKKKYYFVSDTHFGCLLNTHPHQKERKFVNWLSSIEESAHTIYLLGDIIDFWFEYKTVVPKGYARLFGKLAQMTDNGTAIHWFVGNHDTWMFDYLSQEIGITIHRSPLLVELYGKKFYLEHGDRVSLRGKASKGMRWIFHNPFIQRMFQAVHPRWGIDFGLCWSATSRKKEGKEIGYLGEDREHLVLFAKSQVESSQANFFIFGHRHIMLDLMIARQARVIILGDWITYDSYAVWDGQTMALEQVADGMDK